MLRKLVLVHGHWSYYRIADFIIFFFYKNIFFCMLSFYYQFFNGFSGNFPPEEFMMITFNTFWTTPGTLVAFTLNQYSGSKEEILNNPGVYEKGRHNIAFTKKNFFLHLTEALYHSFIVFFIQTVTCWDNAMGRLQCGGGMSIIAIVIMNINLLVRSPNITWVHLLSSFGSIIVTFLWFLLYGMAPFLYRLFNEDPFFTLYMAVAQPMFWCTLLICTILAFLPRIFFQMLLSYNPRYSKEFGRSFMSLQTLFKNPGRMLRKKRFEPVAVSLSDVHMEESSGIHPTV